MSNHKIQQNNQQNHSDLYQNYAKMNQSLFQQKTQKFPVHLKPTHFSDGDEDIQKYLDKINPKSQQKTKKTRVTNYVFPNMIRESKQCLFNSFPGQSKVIYQELEKIFKRQSIKYQVWAFDAIFICFIYLRDKLKIVSKKKYSATIEAISSTLEKFKHKSQSKQGLDEKQIDFIKNQYNICIDHLKVYDDESNTFDSLSGSSGKQIRKQFFNKILVTRKNLTTKFLKKIEEINKNLQSGRQIQKNQEKSGEKEEMRVTISDDQEEDQQNMI